MLPVLQIGPASLPVPGLVIILSIWIGLILSEKFAYRFDNRPEIISNTLSLGLLSGVVGSRSTFVILHLGEFLEDPGATLSLNYHLMDFWGGIIFAFLAILIYGQRKSVKWGDYINAITPMLAVIFVAIPLYEFFGGTNYGIPTDLPWAINLWGLDRHPTQVYDFLASLVILVWILWFIRKPINAKRKYTFLFFVMLTAFSRVIFDEFEVEANLLLGKFRSGQVGAWLIMSLTMISYYFLDRKHKLSGNRSPGENGAE